MRPVLTLMTVLTAALLSGCLALKTPEQLALEPDVSLAVDYGLQPSAAVREELLRRGTFADEEWDLIKSRKIRVGSRELVLLASWGPPWRTERVTTQWGVEATYYYGSHERPTVVVVRQGVVDLIADF